MAGRRQKILNTFLRRFGLNSSGNLVSTVVGIEVPTLKATTSADLKYVDPDTQLLNYVEHFEDFMGDVIPDEWAVNTSGGAAAVAVSVAAGGIIAINAGTNTDGASLLCSALQWTGDKNAVFTARVEIPAAITNFKFEIGLVKDTQTDGAWGALAEDGSGDDSTDCVIFIFDTTKHATTIWAAGSKANTGWGGITTGITLEASTTYDFKIALTDDAALMYYRKVGTHTAWQLVYTKASGAVTAATALQPWFFCVNRAAAGGRILNVDWCYMRQDRT